MKRAIRWGLLVAGALSIGGFLWLVAGLPLGIDGWLNVASAPTPADAIVCIGGGTASNDLPTSDGWQRVYTTTQLY
ncbi:MAG: hypothetical protein WD227_01255, partial [Vicinamibacterales bacterium]